MLSIVPFYFYCLTHSVALTPGLTCGYLLIETAAELASYVERAAWVQVFFGLLTQVSADLAFPSYNAILGFWGVYAALNRHGRATFGCGRSMHCSYALFLTDVLPLFVFSYVSFGILSVFLDIVYCSIYGETPALPLSWCTFDRHNLLTNMIVIYANVRSQAVWAEVPHSVLPWPCSYSAFLPRYLSTYNLLVSTTTLYLCTSVSIDTKNYSLRVPFFQLLSLYYASYMFAAMGGAQSLGLPTASASRRRRPGAGGTGYDLEGQGGSAYDPQEQQQLGEEGEEEEEETGTDSVYDSFGNFKSK